jgi:hypothetical protein
MIQRIRPKLSFANVVSVIALFVALSGAAYAADGLITGKDIKDNTIKGRQVAEKSLKGVHADCPDTATVAIADVCFGPPQAATTWQGAIYACNQAFLRLPDIGEASLVRGSIETPAIWTTTVAGGTPSKAYTLAFKNSATGGTTTVATKDQTQTSAFRCITTPTDGPKGARP